MGEQWTELGGGGGNYIKRNVCMFACVCIYICVYIYIYIYICVYYNIKKNGVDL